MVEVSSILKITVNNNLEVIPDSNHSNNNNHWSRALSSSYKSWLQSLSWQCLQNVQLHLPWHHSNPYAKPMTTCNDDDYTLTALVPLACINLELLHARIQLWSMGPKDDTETKEVCSPTFSMIALLMLPEPPNTNTHHSLPLNHNNPPKRTKAQTPPINTAKAQPSQPLDQHPHAVTTSTAPSTMEGALLKQASTINSDSTISKPLVTFTATHSPPMLGMQFPLLPVLHLQHNFWHNTPVN